MVTVDPEKLFLVRLKTLLCEIVYLVRGRCPISKLTSELVENEAKIKHHSSFLHELSPA